MTPIRAMALDGNLVTDSETTQVSAQVGELIEYRKNGTRRREWITESLDVFRAPRQEGGIDTYRRTDLRTSDGVVVYLLEKTEPPQFFSPGSGMWCSSSGF